MVKLELRGTEAVQRASHGARTTLSRVRQAHRAVVLLMLLILGVVPSCADILGVDPDFKDNPCNSFSETQLEPLECHKNKGACWMLVNACDQLGLPATCPPLAGADRDQCGDGIDNDCDGAIDEEECPCSGDDEKLCYPASQDTLGQEKGLCRGGHQRCQNGVWGQCTDAVIPSKETRDGLDDDCDGEVDEGYSCNDGDEQFCYGGPEGTVGKGLCAYGRQQCVGGRWGDCVDDVLPRLETCDGKDNDCDGETDDVPGVGAECDTGLPAKCKNGVIRCDSQEGKIRCIPVATDTPEECNSEDDNCNNVLNEGAFCCSIDDRQSGNETDVNCGGSCDAKCDVGKKCINNNDCETGICQEGICLPKRPQGQPCDVDTECEHGLVCMDDVCCNDTCTGTCEACTQALRGTGQDGFCGPVARGLDPADECERNEPSSCGQTGYCDGGKKCEYYPSPTPCGNPAKCQDNGFMLEHAYTCNGIGKCEHAIEDCRPYTCEEGACTRLFVLGHVCSRDTQCGEMLCVDGVCCDEECGGGDPNDCVACNENPKGTCSHLPSTRQCRAAENECDVAEQCDGMNAECPVNRFETMGHRCGPAATCDIGANAAIAAGHCDSMGACVAGESTHCDLYVCANQACPTSCSVDSQCVAGAFCSKAGDNRVCQKDTLLLIGGAPNILGAHYHPGDGWTPMTISGTQTTSRVAVALNREHGIGLVRDSKDASSSILYSVQWEYTTGWRPAGRMPLYQGNGHVAIKAWPAIDSNDDSVSAAYLSSNSEYQLRDFSPKAWGMPDTVSEVSDQIELAPDVAVLSSGDRAVAFTTSKDGYYLVQVKIKPSGLGLRDAETLGKSSGSVPPTIAALRDETADLLVVFVDAGGVIHTKQYTARTSTWSELTWRGGHTTDQQVALTTLDHGRAVVAYRSNSSETAGRLFTSFFNPDDDSWSFPEEPVPDIHIVGSPALTRGVGAGAPNKAFVELAYVLDSSTHATGTAGTIHHARCIAMPMNNCTSWTMPERIGDGTDYSSVAIASMPMTARPD